MSETERLTIIVGTCILLGVIAILGTIVWINWTEPVRHGPTNAQKHELQLEQIRTCAHAADVTSCLRDAITP